MRKPVKPSHLLGQSRLKVFYDGLCPLCSREIEHYRKKGGAAKIDWIDITDPSFDAKSEGLDPEEVHRFFHVKDKTGKILVGVDGFIEIWKEIPALSSWVSLSSLPGLKPLMRVGYSAFARVRPFLPRRVRSTCNDETCEMRK